jgi:hypothetical protein
MNRHQDDLFSDVPHDVDLMGPTYILGVAVPSNPCKTSERP